MAAIDARSLGLTHRNESPAAQPPGEEADQRLRHSQAMLARTEGIAHIGSWEREVDTGAVTWSDELYRIVQRDPADGAPSLEEQAGIYPPEDMARLRQAVAAALAEGLPYELELHAVRPDGEVRICLARGFPERDAAGRVARVFGSLQDLTEQRQAEGLLRESEARFNRAFQFMPVSAGITTVQEGRFLAVNRHFEEVFGYREAELLGRTSVELGIWADPGARDQVLALLGQGRPVYSFEFRIRCKDGSLGWVSYSCDQVLINGEPCLLSGAVDISDRRRAEEENVKLLSQLQQAQKMESLGTLAGGIAHDMNNVLGAILGLATANLELQAPGGPARRSFETIAKAATRGGEMVRSLLAFARQTQAEDRVLDLNAILLEEARLLERTTLAKVRLVLDLDPGLRPMRGDASALTNALMNLCVNAVDAMPGDGSLSLRTRNVDREWIEVAVADTGSGMSREVLDRAMEPFFTTKEVGKGTGLGLALVYSAVRAHQGRIEIQSAPGQGTRVTLQFPACAGAAESREPGPAGRQGPAGRVLTVLLVDDDELIRSSVGIPVETLGHALLASPGGEHALARVDGGLRPDVVILDMNMPGLGGTGTLAGLRARLPEVPVLLSTGRADQAALDLAAAYPRVVLLPKPFTLKELRDCLERHGV